MPGIPGMPGYDWRQTYAWNYDHAPERDSAAEPVSLPGSWEFCGLPVGSPLGIPAGPLLNSRWIHYYASLGFDVLTYKTVRTRARTCHPLPNLLPVRDDPLEREPGECRMAEPNERFGSWAISFGMPSRDPEEWQADVQKARQGLGAHQVLVVSVVASPEPNWTEEDIVEDYARCAGWAAHAGAQAIEANLSCPNVSTAEGDLYLRPDLAGRITERLRVSVGELPVILKVGCFADERIRREFFTAVREDATAISTTNTVRARIQASAASGELPFGGAGRGIGGEAVTGRCRQELVQWQRLVEKAGAPLRLISVGGVSSREEVQRRLELGAHHVQLATAAMLDPTVGLRIRREWSESRAAS
jgi:dihydroorotate dehydrogenase (NAD+) catalytic subunit